MFVLLKERKKRKKISSKSQKEEINWRKKKIQQQLKKWNQYCYLTEENLLFFQKATDHAKAWLGHPNFEELSPVRALEKLYYYRASATKYYNYFYLITIPN